MQQLIEATYDRIKDHIRKTPLEYSPFLSQMTGAQVYLKLENWQLSGSFKIRGVMSKVLAIPKEERRKKMFVAASTGNHAAAFAHTMRQFSLEGKVFLPESVSPAKLQFIEAMGTPYVLYGPDSLETEIYTRKYAKENNCILVHPYNDEEIVAGQGTIGLEVWDQLPLLDTIIVPVGGGGLISGIAMYLKAVKPRVQVVGCQPEKSPEMHESLKKGHIIEENITHPTLSDGTAGGIEPGSITFEYCKNFVDSIHLVQEDEIAQAILWMLKNHQMVIEGSAGLSVATLLKNKEKFKGQKVVLILCGRRIGFEKLRGIVQTYL